MLIKDTNYFCICKKKRKIEVMTDSEILDMKEINPEITKEAFNQSEKHIAAQIQKENDINNNLFSLFTVYTTILIALISASIFLSHTNNDVVVAFIVVLALSILTSLIYFLVAYRSNTYVCIGSEPYFWLQKDVISGDNRTLCIKWMTLMCKHQHDIIALEKSNKNKAYLRETGITISIIGLSIAYAVCIEWKSFSSLFQYTHTAIFLIFLFVGFMALLCDYLVKRKWNRLCHYCQQDGKY